MYRLPRYPPQVFKSGERWWTTYWNISGQPVHVETCFQQPKTRHVENTHDTIKSSGFKDSILQPHYSMTKCVFWRRSKTNISGGECKVDNVLTHLFLSNMLPFLLYSLLLLHLPFSISPPLSLLSVVIILFVLFINNHQQELSYNITTEPNELTDKKEKENMSHQHNMHQQRNNNNNRQKYTTITTRYNNRQFKRNSGKRTVFSCVEDVLFLVLSSGLCSCC